jgi:hypothetical protein
MTAAEELDAMFEASRSDIDSEPFAHELQWNQWVGERLQEVPRG